MNKPIHDDKRSEALDAWAAVRADIRVAEEQIARGEGVEHDAARQQVLARLHRTSARLRREGQAA